MAGAHRPRPGLGMIAMARGADVRLPLLHLLFGLVASLVLAAFLLEPGWSIYGLPGSTATLVLTHLFTLGWVTATTVGAMLMIVPVAGVSQVPAGPAALAVPLGILPGVALMLVGFGVGANGVLALGGSLVTLGVIAFALFLAQALRTQTVPSPTPLGALLAGLFLVLTVLFGLTEALNFAYGFWGVPLVRFLALHAVLGGFGWIGLAILSVSYKLVPMFTLSHAQGRHARAVFALWSLGVLWAATMALFGTDALAALAALPALGAYLLFVLDMQRVLAARGRALEPAIRSAILSWVALGVLLLALPLELLGVLRVPPYAFAWVFAFGVAGANLWGFLFKIAPFLVWFHSYADLGPGRKAPKLADMVPQGALRAGTWLLWTGVALGGAGLALGAFPLREAGAACVFLAAATAVCAAYGPARHLSHRRPSDAA